MAECLATDPLPPGHQMVGNTLFMLNGEGGLTPASVVKPEHKLMDELVRKIIGDARPLAVTVGTFRRDLLDMVDSFVDLVKQNYDAKIGGAKGNVTLFSYDRLFKIVVQVPDIIDFGPELEAAKALVDELLTEWSADSRDELKAIVNRAFAVDKKGQINRAALLGLLAHNITDPRWQKAMQALRDSIIIVGSKRYPRMYERVSHDAPWTAISIDMAAG